ncbi:glycoside hydrolase family 16 protein [Mycena maculata]|uniref:Glycoside hydrolase family 16 protein n=1 Tax=Mycena maculata TaxID=230809 RepID=A0AAD7IE01_9AGAR|nr:glycoside hydrolase family 16 protein [Mycena maculata]
MSPSQTALHQAYQAGQASASVHDLGAPTPPFAAGGSQLPRTSSQTNFRAPFLSPASRPSSTYWSPPSYVGSNTLGSGGSSTALALPPAPAPMPSTRLPEKLTKEEKPWLQRAAPRARVSWWLTALMMILGLAGAAVLCYFGVVSTQAEVFKDSQLCSVLSDDFSNGLDLTNTWNRDIELGGFGNAEFQIASGFDNVSFVKNNELYIFPQLTSDFIGEDTVTSGSYTVPDCSTTNLTACTASGNGVNSVVNPVMSARLNTLGHYSIQYGRVEVVAKMPLGDWLWPAIWMLPVNGSWPLDGEADLCESRGNGPSYAAQGSNYVRSTIQYGPFSTVLARLWGWYGLKRTSFDKGFHTYGMEWDENWMRFYVDTRVHTTLSITTKTNKQSFWNRAGFPVTAQNGSGEVVVEKPASYTNINSPFDQPFYLIIDLAVGGTSGWFPDEVGNKPWFDGSLTAMYDFWTKQSTWYATWPTNEDDRSFRISSVKMWKKC